MRNRKVPLYNPFIHTMLLIFFEFDGRLRFFGAEHDPPLPGKNHFLALARLARCGVRLFEPWARGSVKYDSIG